MEYKNDPASEWFVIANPVAGGGRVRRQWAALTAWLQQHLKQSAIQLTEYPGHAAELAEQALQQGYRRLLALGGDGTCHEVVNGIFRQQAVPHSEVQLALLPVGTGNDWIRTHGVPRRLDRWLDMLRGQRFLLHDIGHIRYQTEQGEPAERYFFNVAGMAFDAFVTKKAGEGQRRAIPAYYLLLILRYLMAFQPVPGRIRFDGQERSGSFITIEAGIGRFAGGGLQLAPHADPADGLLALTFAHPTAKLDILLNLWRFFDGSIGRHPRIETHQTRELDVQPLSDRPLLLEADGEYLGYTPAFFRIIPQALQVLVP